MYKTTSSDPDPQATTETPETRDTPIDAGTPNEAFAHAVRAQYHSPQTDHHHATGRHGFRYGEPRARRATGRARYTAASPHRSTAAVGRENASDYDNLEVHPLAEWFPVMDAHTFDTLKDSIQEHGLLRDGRFRMTACGELGIKLTTADLQDLHHTLALEPITREQAGAMYGVSVSAISEFRKIKFAGWIAQMRAGSLSLWRAKELQEKQDKEVAKANAAGERHRAREARKAAGSSPGSGGKPAWDPKTSKATRAYAIQHLREAGIEKIVEGFRQLEAEQAELHKQQEQQANGGNGALVDITARVDREQWVLLARDKTRQATQNADNEEEWTVWSNHTSVMGRIIQQTRQIKSDQLVVIR